MATTLDTKIAARLSRLPRGTRERVEDALRRTLELELAREAGRPHPLEFSRSRSLVFSRSSGDARADGEPDYRLLLGLAMLDEKAFAAFLGRFTEPRHATRASHPREPERPHEPERHNEPVRDSHGASHPHAVKQSPASQQSRRAGTARATPARPTKESGAARTTRRKK